jgi:hypothetical protein
MMSQLGRSNQSGEKAAQTGVTRRAAPMHPVMRLQRQVGNQAVAAMLAQRAGEEDELQMSRDATVQRAGEEDELQMSRDPAVQRAEEDELQMSRDPAVQREEEDELQMSRDPAVQRAGEEDELQMSRDVQRAEEDELQMARDGGPEVGLAGGPLSGATTERIQAARGSGAELDAGTRESMESSFDTSFSDVRVHTGGEASSLNKQLGAVAFTTGNDIFMRDGAYQPGSGEGNQLLAHELTHVVQQRSMPASGSGGMQVGPAGDHYEQAAEASAATAAAPAAQRHSDDE